MTNSGSIALTEITEENNYYPFGLKHQGYNSVVSSNANAVAGKFKYNGKELQDDDVNGNKLNLYDYGARFYDAALGRWHCVDPLAEVYSYVSPYIYVMNNPILMVDPNGMDWYKYSDAQGNEHYRYQDGDSPDVEIDGNTYSNIGSTASIRISEDTYLNVFQNISMYSYDEGVNLKDKILGDDGLRSKYLNDNSSLSEQGKIELFSSNIHNYQNKFLKGAARITASSFENVGDIATTLGYPFGLTPVGAAVVGIGKTFSITGGLLNSALDISEGEIVNGSIGVGTSLIGYGVGRNIKNAKKFSKADKFILSTGSDLKIKLAAWISITFNNKKKQKK
ncbi:MAG: hypothetical protein DRI74_07190 [Bacteroidetes bacterium]|nr:MAG: hypothetical protein DRI74_07190 [Bacteroidota bacterium]